MRMARPDSLQQKRRSQDVEFTPKTSLLFTKQNLEDSLTHIGKISCIDNFELKLLFQMVICCCSQQIRKSLNFRYDVVGTCLAFHT